MTNRSNLAATVAEPDDGTTLLIENVFEEFTPIRRDDDGAEMAEYDVAAGQRWFVATSEPEGAETWHGILDGAVRIHFLTVFAELEKAAV
jgi:hypothetical protein